ncbi:hypothetical protein EB001_05030 [bacterium]|nr:hypothetical protein [bacterium]
MNRTTTISHEVFRAIETLDYVQIYNYYAQWIKDNMWAWKSGSHSAVQPFNLATRPNGLTAFAEKNYNFASKSHVQRFQRKCSKFLSKNPEVLKSKAGIFAETFPTLVQIKIKDKQKQYRREEKLRDANLCSHFDIAEETQMEIPVKTSVESIDTNLSEYSENIRAITEFGAKYAVKSIKSPDGWEVQF